MELLAAALRERGYVVLVTREPGGTALGEAIRDLLLDPRYHGMSARAEALLYAAARAHLVEQVIRPALEDGQVVLCDRYLDSSLAYQGYGRGLGTDDIITLNVWATECLFPDLTLFLDLDDSVRSTRLAAVPDRLEAEDEDFHRRVAEGYRELAAAASVIASAGSMPGAARPRCRSGCGPWSKRNWSCSATRMRTPGAGGDVRSLFADIVGQQMAVSILTRALEQGASHAYLFSGPPGVGKSEAALAFAAGLACADGGCGVCTTCRRVLEGLHPDVEIVAPEGNFIRKEEITEINLHAVYRPYEARAKVYVFLEADSFNAEAANAFLKTLEEPPAHVHFILVTDHPEKLLPTIVSRCQLVAFSPVPVPALAADLLERFGLPEARGRLWWPGWPAGISTYARELATSESARRQRGPAARPGPGSSRGRAHGHAGGPRRGHGHRRGPGARRGRPGWTRNCSRPWSGPAMPAPTG